MTAIVRPVATDDWPALFRLWVDAWTAFLPAIDFEARLPWFQGYVAELQDEGAAVLVAAEDAGPLGFATVDAVRQDLDQLVIAPAAQRRGIGRQLLRAAQDVAPGGLGLKVVKVNHPAIALYRSEGFEIVGEGISERSGLPNYAMRWPGTAGAARPGPKLAIGSSEGSSAQAAAPRGVHPPGTIHRSGRQI